MTWQAAGFVIMALAFLYDAMQTRTLRVRVTDAIEDHGERIARLEGAAEFRARQPTHPEGLA